MFLTPLWSVSWPECRGEAFCLCPMKGDREEGSAAHRGAAGGLQIESRLKVCMMRSGNMGGHKKGEEQCVCVFCACSCHTAVLTHALCTALKSLTADLLTHSFSSWSFAKVPPSDADIHHSLVSVWLSWPCDLWFILTSWGQTHSCAFACYFNYFTYPPSQTGAALLPFKKYVIGL